MTKTLLISTSIILLIVITFGLIAFVPVGAQTLGSKIFDSLGMNKTALAVDSFAKGKGDMLTTFASVDLKNPNSCKVLWKNSDLITKDSYAVSGKLSNDIRPINKNYTDKFFVKSHINGKIDTKTPAVNGYLNIKATADIDEIKKIAKEADSSSLEKVTETGLISGQIKFESIINSDDLLLNLNQLTIQTSSKTFSKSMKDWYNLDSKTTEIQKEGIKELVSEIQNLMTKTNPKDVFSDSTGELMAETACSVIDEIKVGNVENRSFGENDNQISKDVRSIEIKLKDNAQQIFVDNSDKIIEAIKNDSKTKDFLKSKYPEFERISFAANKIANNSRDTRNNSLNQQDYETYIDDSFNEIDSSEFKQDLQTQLDTSERYYKQTTEKMTYYLEMENLEVYGFETNQKVTLTDRAKESFTESSKTISDILSEGIIINTQVYDLGYDEKANKINTPNSSKPLSEFEKDFGGIEELPLSDYLK
jgi:hypothetical protein